MLDRYVHGQVTRLSPEAPVPILSVDKTQVALGGGANVAANLKGLGADVKAFGLVGQDPEAAQLRSMMSALGIVSCLESTSAPTIVKTRLIQNGRHLFRVDFERQFSAVDASKLACDFTSQIHSAKIVVLSDYDKGTLVDPQVYIQAARKAGLRICVDPKRQEFECYRGASVATPNAVEFEQATGTPVSSAEFPHEAETLRRSLSLDALLVTAGVSGGYLLEAGRDMLHISANRVSARDVTGAGDVVIASLADGLARNLSMEDAARRAIKAGTISVMQSGTGVVTREMLETQPAMNHAP
ncbi:D-glycero-beta-D-manno-heptose-7-phosphate kinase [Ruegeria sp. HKCCD6119]|nr:D-glycero-beta-D-manno-heptose-7-phosphate kinase [Ruegeria sp. HKCCD6119]